MVAMVESRLKSRLRLKDMRAAWLMSLMLAACSNATPTLTTLSNAIPGPLFSGSSTLDERIYQAKATLNLSATCDARVTGWEFSLDGVTWTSLEQIASSGTSSGCSNREARFLLSAGSFGFTPGAANGASETRSLMIRGITAFGTTQVSTVNLTYTRYPLVKSGLIASGAALQSGTAAGTRYVVRATISGLQSEKTLADSGEVRRIQLSRGK